MPPRRLLCFTAVFALWAVLAAAYSLESRGLLAQSDPDWRNLLRAFQATPWLDSLLLAPEAFAFVAGIFLSILAAASLALFSVVLLETEGWIGVLVFQALLVACPALALGMGRVNTDGTGLLLVPLFLAFLVRVLGTAPRLALSFTGAFCLLCLAPMLGEGAGEQGAAALSALWARDNSVLLLAILPAVALRFARGNERRLDLFVVAAALLALCLTSIRGAPSIGLLLPLVLLLAWRSAAAATMLARRFEKEKFALGVFLFLVLASQGARLAPQLQSALNARAQFSESEARRVKLFAEYPHCLRLYGEGHWSREPALRRAIPYGNSALLEGFARVYPSSYFMETLPPGQAAKFFDEGKCFLTLGVDENLRLTEELFGTFRGTALGDDIFLYRK